MECTNVAKRDLSYVGVFWSVYMRVNVFYWKYKANSCFRSLWGLNLGLRHQFKPNCWNYFLNWYQNEEKRFDMQTNAVNFGILFLCPQASYPTLLLDCYLRNRFVALKFYVKIYVDSIWILTHHYNLTKLNKNNKMDGIKHSSTFNFAVD